MTLWLVRAGKNGEDESLCLDKGRVIIGWQEMPETTGQAQTGGGISRAIYIPFIVDNRRPQENRPYNTKAKPQQILPLAQPTPQSYNSSPEGNSKNWGKHMFKLKESEIETEQSQPAGFVKRRSPASLLLLTRGQEVGSLDDRVELTESITVGRERPCALTLNDSCMSAVHFRVILNDGRASISTWTGRLSSEARTAHLIRTRLRQGDSPFRKPGDPPRLARVNAGGHDKEAERRRMPFAPTDREMV